MMKRLSYRLATSTLLAAMMLAGAQSAIAATIANGDDASVVLKISEDGSETEVVLDAGASDQLCQSGCFLTLPNGDRIGLSGDENLKIVKGAAVLQ